MGIFGGIQEAKYSEGGIYLKPGVFRLRVLACKKIQARTGKAGFVVELEVMESTNPELLPGSNCSWLVMLDKEPALGNIKQFIVVAAPCKEEQVTEEAVEMIVGQTNPLKGRVLRCAATNIKTKKGTDFTKVKWLEDNVGAAGAAKEAAAEAA